MKAVARALAPGLLAALALSGCGEKTYSPDEVVAELNAAGAQLEIGQPLTGSSEQETEIVTVTFAEEGEPEAGVIDAHGAGAIVVVDDAELAGEEFDRCEAAVDFTCFRVANAVLRFTGISPDEQADLTAAIRSLETG